MDWFRGLFASIGFLILSIYLVYQSFNHCGLNSMGWPKTSGEIVSVKTRTATNKSADAFIRYEYSVDNIKYISERVVCSGLGTQIEYASKYPEGKEIIVYYNPSNPENSVLEPGIPMRELIVGVISGIVGLLSLYFIFRYIRQIQSRIFAPQ
jgi:hypothetical protein